jgi:hypothetical protein
MLLSDNKPSGASEPLLQPILPDVKSWDRGDCASPAQLRNSAPARPCAINILGGEACGGGVP